MAYVRKLIETTITLGKGQFGNQPDANSSVLSGYRTIVNLQAYYGSTMGAVQCRIYGLNLDFMNQLTTIGPIAYQIRTQNTISIAAGDEGSALTTVFTGAIHSAWADFSTMPDVALNVLAYSALAHAVIPVNALSFKGTQSVDTIVGQVVSSMNNATPGTVLTYVNHGVDTVLTDAYLPGSGLDQIKLVAKSAKFDYSIEQNVLTIWPKGVYTNDGVITLSPNSDPGIVGYPTFSGQGVGIKSLFVPNLRQGQQVIVAESQLPQANGSWQVNNVTHTLESERPGGAWFTNFIGLRIGGQS